MERIVFDHRAAPFQHNLRHGVILTDADDVHLWFTMVAYSGAWVTSMHVMGFPDDLKWALPGRKLPRLTTLCIDSGPPVVSFPVAVVTAILSVSTLTSLRIADVGAFHDKTIMLLHGLRSLPLLTDLLVPYPDTGDDMVGFSSVVLLPAVAPQLRRLTLRGMADGEAGLVASCLCTSLPWLNMLNLTDHPAVEYTGMGIGLTCSGGTLSRLSTYRYRIQVIRIHAATGYTGHGLQLLGEVVSFELFAKHTDAAAAFMKAAAQAKHQRPLRRLVVHLTLAPTDQVTPLCRLLNPLCTPHLQYVEMDLGKTYTPAQRAIIRHCFKQCTRIPVRILTLPGDN